MLTRTALRFILPCVALTASTLLSAPAFAQRTVSSLEAMITEMTKSNVNIKLARRTYIITGRQARNGRVGVEGWKAGTTTLFRVSGSNSVYDFDGATLEVENTVYQAFGRRDVHTFTILGNGNVIKNLILKNTGAKTEAPSRRAVNFVVDGQDNVIDRLTLTTTGSYPYGYGELFGKGGGSVIPHRKKSSFLLRGTRNTLKRSRINHQSFGHAVFMQAAESPTIDRVTINGEIRFTNNVLSENNTDASRVNFESTWGYRIPRDYAFSTGEAGIRAYNRGTTVINGRTLDRRTTDVTVKGCNVTKMRVGVALSQARGFKRVSDTRANSCTLGFGIDSGSLTNCRADARYGAALSTDGGGLVADLTLQNFPGSARNGGRQVAMIAGSNHNITLRDNVSNESNHVIQVGGDLRQIQNLAGNEGLTATNCTIVNYTSYPMVLDSRATGNSVRSAGSVTNNGRRNGVTRIR